MGGVVQAHRCDVRSESDVAALFAAVGDAAGRVDVLVNNAGIFPLLEFEKTTIADYDLVMDVNVRGVFLCTMAALPLMRDRGGSMVFMSSGAGTLAAVEQPTARRLPLYGASKAAVDRWALGVAHELERLGIAANVLYPGAFVRTRGLAALDLDEAQLADTVDPSYVAPALVFLARQRVGGICGRLVKASEFGSAWGPGIS
jgi:NAD(P)-dependent dehydrogenase (short-subunit alcohol dehydrogenase family)